MPTTSYTDTTFSASVIGARTDNTGAAVTDTTAEEARMAASIFNPGYLSPTGAFQVTAQTSPNMTVKVGSGTAKTDYYVLSGTVAGQGNYIVRLDAVTPSVTISAADPSQIRTDEIYLVVQDNLYDISSRALPRLGYRKGDLGGANPGPDGAWTAYALLARVAVAAAATSITNGNITDQRISSSLPSSVSVKALFTTKGDLLAGTGVATAMRVGVGTDKQILTADPAQTAGFKWANLPTAAAAAAVSTSESTTSSSYTDLTTPGPAVTVTVGPLGIAVVHLDTEINITTSNDVGTMNFATSGANTISAGTANPLNLGIINVINTTWSNANVLTGLTPGSTTFTAKYSNAGAHGATFKNRHISVVTF